MRRLLLALAIAGLVSTGSVQRADGVEAAFTAPIASQSPVAAVAPIVQAVQLTLRHYGYAIAVDGRSGPQTAKIVSSWQRSNGLAQTGVIDLKTIASLGIGGAASAPADRTQAPPPNPTAGLDACGMLMYYRIQAGLPAVFDAIGYRESRCDNTVTSSTGCCVGALQIGTGNFTAPGYRDGIAACGVTRRSDIMGDNDSAWKKQMCVAAVLYRISDMQPWAL